MNRLTLAVSLAVAILMGITWAGLRESVNEHGEKTERSEPAEKPERPESGERSHETSKALTPESHAQPETHAQSGNAQNSVPAQQPVSPIHRNADVPMKPLPSPQMKGNG